MSAVEQLMDREDLTVGRHSRDVRVDRARPVQLRQESEEVAHEDARDAAVADDDDRLALALLDDPAEQAERAVEDGVEGLAPGPLDEAVLVPVRVRLRVLERLAGHLAEVDLAQLAERLDGEPVSGGDRRGRLARA